MRILAVVCFLVCSVESHARERRRLPVISVLLPAGTEVLEGPGTVVLTIEGPEAREVELLLWKYGKRNAPLGFLVGTVTGPHEFTWQVGEYVTWTQNDREEQVPGIARAPYEGHYMIGATYRGKAHPWYGSDDFTLVKKRK